MMVLSTMSCLSVVSFAANVVASGYTPDTEDAELPENRVVAWEFYDDGVLYLYDYPGEVSWKSFADVLTKVELKAGPNATQCNLIEIPAYAFNGCYNLTEVDLSKGVKLQSIGAFAFQNCSALEKIDLNQGIMRLGDYAFYGCSSLKNVEFSYNLATVGKNVFKGCSALETAVVPNGVLTIGYGMFEDCTALKTLELPDSLTTIGELSFEDCVSLEEIVVPDSVTTVGRYAFHNCTSAKTAYIGHNAEDIGEYAFYGCSSLEEVEFASAMRVFSEGMFMNCAALTSIIVEEGVETIGKNAFKGCSALTAVSLPSTLKTISDSAFDSTALSTIDIPADVATIEDGAFSNCVNLTAINVDGKNDAYCSKDGILYDIALGTLILCPAGKSGEVTVPDAVETISDDAFIGCKNITKVTIPDSVTTIGSNAFNNCADELVIKANCDSSVIVYANTRGIATELVHTGEQSWVETLAPTCDAAGIKELVCSACGYVYETADIEKLTHALDEGTIKTPATCEKDGEIVYKCQNTGCIYTKTEAIPATGHKLDAGTVTLAPDCENDGVFTRTCVNGCGHTETTPVPAIGHDLDDGKITVYPTINKQGEKLFTCQREDCDYTKTEAIPNTAFSDILAINEEAYADENNVIQNITWYLTKDGVLYVFADGTEAEWEDYKAVIKTAVIAKTVSTIGKNAFMNCSALSEVSLAEGVKVLEKNAFKGCGALTEITLPETLETIGDSAFDGTSLSVINIPADVEVIEKGAFTNCTALTAINVDNKNDNYFSVGGVLYSVELGTLVLCPAGKTGEVAVWDGATTIAEDAFIGCKGVTAVAIPNSVTSISPNAFNNCATALVIKGNCDSTGIAFAKSRGIATDITHVASSAWQIIKPATCLENGSENLVCTGCGYVYETREILALDHNYDNGVVTKAATCDADGVMTFTCTRVDCSVSYTEVIPALKHNYDTGKVIQAATCTDDGTMRYSCQNDGCLSYYDEVIEKTGHNMDNGTIKTPATCETDGEKVYKCQNVGCLHKTTEVIPATGHSYDKGVVTKAATCTEDGVKTFTCQNCELTYTEKVDAIGHNYIAVEVKKATCLEDGKIQHTCENCGDFYTEATKGEHVPYSTPVKVGPTCTEAGKEGTMCAVCRQFIGETKELAATGHTYENGVCTGCGDKKETQAPSKPGSTVITPEKNPESTGSSSNSGTASKVPATPKLLLLSNRNEGLVLTWKSVEGATGYRVYRRAAGAKSWTYLGTVKECTYTDKNAATGQYWRYTVRAVNDAGFSGFENGIYIKRVATPHLTSIANTATGVKVTWSAVSNAKTYKVYRRGAGETWKCIATVTGTSFVDTSIKANSGNYYRYTVRAVDGYYSAYESGLLIKFVATPHLTGIANTSNGVKVDWKAVSGADSYRVYRRAAGKSWVYVTTVTGTSYVDTAIKDANGYYKYTVRAVDGSFSGYESGLLIKK